MLYPFQFRIDRVFPQGAISDRGNLLAKNFVIVGIQGS